MKLLTLFTASALLAGCASPSMYQWGGYDELLYRSYKDPEKVLAMRTTMEAHVLTLQQSGQKVPPGLYSEIATLHLQAGDRASARRFYAQEKETWPESRGLMEALIQNLDKKGATP